MVGDSLTSLPSDNFCNHGYWKTRKENQTEDNDQQSDELPLKGRAAPKRDGMDNHPVEIGGLQIAHQADEERNHSPID